MDRITKPIKTKLNQSTIKKLINTGEFGRVTTKYGDKLVLAKCCGYGIFNLKKDTMTGEITAETLIEDAPEWYATDVFIDVFRYGEARSYIDLKNKELVLDGYYDYGEPYRDYVDGALDYLAEKIAEATAE